MNENDLAKAADQFEAYTQQLYAAYPKGAAAAGFVSKEQFLAMHVSPVKQGWEGYQQLKTAKYAAAYGSVTMGNAVMPTPVELEEAAPFIRLVIERILDLLDSEDKWIKGELTVNDEKWCILGAMAQAEKDLALAHDNARYDLNEARNALLTTIKRFFEYAAQEDHGKNVPGFNDASSTSFEDVRLWVKGLGDRLPD